MDRSWHTKWSQRLENKLLKNNKYLQAPPIEVNKKINQNYFN